jgi:hypothetical protein
MLWTTLVCLALRALRASAQADEISQYVGSEFPPMNYPTVTGFRHGCHGSRTRNSARLARIDASRAEILWSEPSFESSIESLSRVELGPNSARLDSLGLEGLEALGVTPVQGLRHILGVIYHMCIKCAPNNK